MTMHKAVIKTYIDTRLAAHQSVPIQQTQGARKANTTWGWSPILSVVGAIGLLIVAFADTIARNGSPAADSLFWFGILLLFLPITARLAGSQATRAERIVLIMLLGLGLALVKVLHSPIGFAFGDEFPHWHTVDAIIRTQHLFSYNSLQQIDALYVGLHSVTAALVSLGGCSIFTAGVIVIIAARMVLVLALYLLYERVSESPRAAGIALTMYMANPPYVFWSSQFAYESLALPLATFVLFVIVRRAEEQGNSKLGLNLIIILAIGAIVITHHMTTYALIAAMCLWSVITLLHGKREKNQFVRTALLTLVIGLSWLVYVASLTIGYLGPVLTKAALALGLLIVSEGDTGQRILFRSAGGQVAPIWEQGTAIASVCLILVLLPFGLIWTWRYYRNKTFAMTLGVGALAYPLLLVLRLTGAGAETSNRSNEFLFVALAFVLAIGMERIWLAQGHQWWRPTIIAALISVLFSGGIIIGLARWARMPGPYEVGGDTRGLQLESEAAATWMPQAVGAENTFISDRTNQLLMGSYGQQTRVSGLSWIFFAPQFDASVYTALREKGVRYIVVDRRLSTSVPRTGSYFESGEPNAGLHLEPIDIRLLTKFDTVPGICRIFDSGNIVIYDISPLLSSER